MAKNIVVFSDGTGQDGGMRPEQVLSNIYKLYRACRISPNSAIDPNEQVTFYDPGLGTDTSATGWTRIAQWFQKLHASVTGRGIAHNIADCYEFIINHYEVGDRIFLFGFSRGAYTVRSVANLLMLCGVPTIKDGSRLQKFRKTSRDIAEEAVYRVLEHGAGHPREVFEAERFELARRFRDKYGSHYSLPDEDQHRSNAAPYFIGVFDTVAALGVKGSLWVIHQAILYSLAAVGGAIAGVILLYLASLIGGGWLSSYWLLGAAAGGMVVMRFAQRRGIKKVIEDFPSKGQSRAHYAEWKGEHFDRLLSRHVPYARSANAIDELREDFARCHWGKGTDNVPNEVDGVIRLKQVWFAGNHSDVGGSYPETESRLSDITLVWMIQEALSLPLPIKIGPVFVNGEKLAGSGDDGEALRLFPSVAGLQHCEVAGMRDTVERRTPSLLRRFTKNLGYRVKPRIIDPNASVHASVIERLQLAEVGQCTSWGPYRPSQLAAHNKCVMFYQATEGETSTIAGSVQ